jgi:outer membrane protein assembly factor BamB
MSNSIIPRGVSSSKRKKATVHAFLCAALIVAMGAASVSADDWPTYRRDIARSGITTEQLETTLQECWIYQPTLGPQPAWGDPNPRPVGGWHGLTEERRVHFDDAFHATAADGAVYFGSSADGKVYSLDASTGEQRWSFMTDGPIRLAPTLSGDNVYVGSDDGYVYCLSASDGSLVWKFQAAPRDDMLLGSGKMVSLWPIRTGVLIDADVAYFGAGIFPAEGVFFYAVNATTGELLWCNDSCGEKPMSRISPQGYMLASESRLFAPLGRVSPAAFDRKDGSLLYEAYVEHIIGGTNALLAGDELFTGTEEIIGYDQETSRARSSWFWGSQLIVTPDTFYSATGRQLFAVNRAAYEAASMRRKSLLSQKRDAKGEQLAAVIQQINEVEAEMASGELWRIECDCEETLVMAGDSVIAGGEGKVVIYNAATGEETWSTAVEGRARGVAVAEGRLLVSTDSGAIYCYGPQDAETYGRIEPPAKSSPFPVDEMTPVYEAAAEDAVRGFENTQGYCLVLGCETGRLAAEIAKRTPMRIVAIDPDAQKVEAARRALDAAGLYGARVTIVQGDLSETPLPDYFANLIVSEDALVSGNLPPTPWEISRMLKPLGGTIRIAQPLIAPARIEPIHAVPTKVWANEVSVGGKEFWTVEESSDEFLLELVRGSLPGAGSWTHQYANPGNTTCSDDQLIRCPLGVLWYGGPGPEQMPERHRRSQAPLASNGRFFVIAEGLSEKLGSVENTIMAYDAYNGVKLWERTIPGALRVSVTHDSGNSACNDDHLFIAVDDGCHQLDAATGETVKIYSVPATEDGTSRRWGYVGVVDNLLYGSRTAQGRVGDCVFAYEISTGELCWKYEAEGISHGAIAIGDGHFFLATNKVTEAQRQASLVAKADALHHLSEEVRNAELERLQGAVLHRVIALDATSGETQWEDSVEVTGAVGGSYWCSLNAVYQDNVLVLFGVFLDGHYWSQFFSGQFDTRRVVALAGHDGGLLWQQQIGYRVRPIIVGDTLHAEPWAYDLQTGIQQTRINPVTGQEEAWQFARPGHHCGCPAASPHTLLFRSYNLGWYDLESDFGTQHFGAQRPGCWINFIPANGLLMMPEASSGCMCPFSNMFSIVFKSKEENRQWAYFSHSGPMTPVKRLGLNLGAMGDRKDDEKDLWLGYPRPSGSLVLQFDAETSYYPGWSEFKHDPAILDIEGTDTPWLFRSGVCGLKKCVIPVAEPNDGTALYTVRLGFAELEHDASGKRVFDIKLQGEIVAEDFDIYQAVGAQNKAIFLEFDGLEATDNITLELIPKTDNPTPDQLPILQAIEIEREEFLTLGVTAPSFELRDASPTQSGEIQITNNHDEDFSGILRIETPDGFTVEPEATSIQLPAGEKATFSISVTVAEPGDPASLTLNIFLLHDDGQLECKRESPLEYLGNRKRVVLTAIEDAHVHQSNRTKNYGTNTTMLVDGGDQEMGDHHHGIVHMRFRTDFRGNPDSAVLRLHNSDNPTHDSGQVRLIASDWSESGITYDTRPTLGDVLGNIGPVSENQIIEIPLEIEFKEGEDLCLAIDPTSCDGIFYKTRESDSPPELVIEYVE